MSRNQSEKITKSTDGHRLGDFAFSMTTRELKNSAGSHVHLRAQSAEVLAFLLERSGDIVPKAKIIENVWQGVSVTDDSLVQCITDIRRCLNDKDRKIIQTIAKRGYRVRADPQWIDGDCEELLLPARPSIAVLAFEDYSVGSDAGYLSDAIAEGIIAELSRFPELFVIARNSSFRFRGKATDMREISRQLGVRYVLEGSQQKVGDLLRVTVQLIDPVQGHHLWANTYDSNLWNLLATQENIVQRIVATTAQKIISYEASAVPQTQGAALSALRLHLEARKFLAKFTPEGNAQGKAANLKAIECDPGQPYGYVGLAFASINEHRWGWAGDQSDAALQIAHKAALRAIEVAPDYYDGHAALAQVYLHQDDVERAIERAERARSLNPNDTYVMCDLADLLGYVGRGEDAEKLLGKAIRLDPMYPDWMRWVMAWIQWLNGKSETALRTLQSMSEVPPMAKQVLAIVQVELDQLNEATVAINDLLAHNPGYSLAEVRRKYRGKFKNKSDLVRLLNNLRKAGLPEE